MSNPMQRDEDEMRRLLDGENNEESQVDIVVEVNNLIEREMKWLDKMKSNDEMYHERHINDIRYDIQKSERKIATLKKILKMLIIERI